MNHRVISPALGDRIIDSMLVNGDWNPDVIVIAAQTASRERVPIDTRLVADILAEQGHKVNDDGTVEYAL